MSELIFDINSHSDLWGQGCPEPTIVVENITIPKSAIQIIGSKKDTIKFSFNDICYIVFKANDIIELLNELGDSLNITCIGKANVNTWGGQYMPQLYVSDIDIKNTSNYDF